MCFTGEIGVFYWGDRCVLLGRYVCFTGEICVFYWGDMCVLLGR